MVHLNIPYQDVMMMPTHDRRLFLSMFRDEKMEEKEQYEQMRNQSSGSNGKRSTTLSGDAAKQFAIDNQ